MTDDKMLEQRPEADAKKIWDQYSAGRKYNEALHIYDTVQKCEDFFIGRQWKGAEITELDTPVINFLKRVVNFFISNIVSEDIGIHMETFDDSEDDLIPVGIAPEIGEDTRQQATMKAVIEMLDSQLNQIIELSEFKKLLRRFLRDSAVDGDGCIHFWFDVDDNQGIKPGSTGGNIKAEIIPNHMVIFGNTETTSVKRQPYIILEMRKSLKEVRELAKENHVADWDTIQADREAKGINADNESNKVTLLRKYWFEKKTGTVWCVESTEKVIVTPPMDTGCKLYPIIWMPWEEVKNEYHGMGAVEALISNQIYVNKLYAMAGYSVKTGAFSKVIYDASKLPNGWSNRVGEAIPVYGDPNLAVANSFKQADMSNQVFEMIARFMQDSKDTMGSSDASLGNINPQNTSAIIATQKATSMPLELNKSAFYDCVEDAVRIWLDMIAVRYGLRQVKLEVQQPPVMDPMTGEMIPQDPVKQSVMFNFEDLTDLGLKLNVDIGAATYWSELMQVQILDNLFINGILTDPEVYINAIPAGYIQNKGEILKSVREARDRAEQAQMMQNIPMDMAPMEAPAAMGGLADAINKQI